MRRAPARPTLIGNRGNQDDFAHQPARGACRPLAAVRRFAGRWGLIAALAALPVYYGIHDLVYGYQAGVVAGHAVIHHDLANLGYDVAQGLSNGAIWALIAIGYTLVYGIIELINFAHGDVFMIGSFTSVSLWGGVRARAHHQCLWD